MGTKQARATPCFCFLLVLVLGCGTLDPAADVEEIRTLAEERGAEGLAWDRNEVADEAITVRARELLREDLTPTTAVQIALLRNRGLQAALARIGIARAELVQAGLLQNPVLSAGVRFAVGAAGTGADLAIVQEFLSVLQIPLRKRVAKAELEATKLAVAAEVFELSASVREAFYDAQAARQLLKLRGTARDATSASADLARRQHEAGNITDLDHANEQALYAETKLHLAEAEVDAIEKREHLTALLGLWGPDTLWSMSDRLPSLPSSEREGAGLETLAVAKRLDLAEARHRIGASAQSVALIRFYGLMPEASLGVDAEREVEGGIWSVGPSIELPIPLFDQRQARIAAAKATQRQGEESFAALAVEIRSEVRRAYARLGGARSRAAYYEQVVLPLRRKILDETQREYNAMQVGPYQLLQAKRDEIETGRAYIETLRDYWLSRVALDRAVGIALPIEGDAPKPSSLPEATPSPTSPQNDPHHHGG
jgi:outer membrane protein, heavy metal efflux system